MKHFTYTKIFVGSFLEKNFSIHLKNRDMHIIMYRPTVKYQYSGQQVSEGIRKLNSIKLKLIFVLSII